MRSKLLVVFRQILIFSAVVLLVGQWQSRNLPTGLSPQVKAQDLSGNAVNFPNKGVVSIVYFFAPWCGVCRVSMPNLKALKEYFPEIDITAVAFDFESPDEVRVFKSEVGVNLPILLGEETARRLWKVSAYPTYIVVDKGGVIRGASVGYSSQMGMIIRLLWAKILS